LSNTHTEVESDAEVESDTEVKSDAEVESDYPPEYDPVLIDFDNLTPNTPIFKYGQSTGLTMGLLCQTKVKVIQRRD